jgi:RimJ/RimL family protein N-acetyltransferase
VLLTFIIAVIAAKVSRTKIEGVRQVAILGPGVQESPNRIAIIFPMAPQPITPEGRTKRLILRPLALEDADQIQALFPQWEIVRFLRSIVPWPYPPNGAIEDVRDIALPEMQRGESFNWTLRLIADPDKIIGFLGLKLGESHNRGFWLDPRHQGHGLMTEACVWANDFWFDVLGQTTLRVTKAIANTASRRISLKHGMRVIGTEETNYVSGRHLSEIWELTAAEWRAQRLAKP